MNSLADLHRAPAAVVLEELARAHPIPADITEATQERAHDLVSRLRSETDPGLMETFLGEYGLSTDEGVALMCLAEALLRVPDADTVDALIEDKIAPSEWGEHLGRSSSSLVNASTWALMLTGKVLDTDEARGPARVLRGLVRRLGEPVIRVAVARAMRELGNQFVLGETIAEAVRRKSDGYTYSYDMLGEAAMTADDAERYFESYRDAIQKLAPDCRSEDIRANPGISIKLSALHPRYDELQRDRVMEELVPRVAELAKMAADAGMGLNIDAEESDRLELSLDIFEAVIADNPGWGGLGMVIQAYGKRAPAALDRVAAVAREAGERCMVRLVKGAYWDTEVKRAQVDGVADFPVFARKSDTDAAYLMCAGKTLDAVDTVYPQFATHNAHTAAAVLELAKSKGVAREAFEFQRLHGMGEALHALLITHEGVRCRIYAPVGAHRDLLAYLVRRLLENGANSSFVSQITDEDVPIEAIIADPLAASRRRTHSAVRLPGELYGHRTNSAGWDLREAGDRARFQAAREPWREHVWSAEPILSPGADPGSPDEKHKSDGDPGSEVGDRNIINPARLSDTVGHVREATPDLARAAVSAARPWSAPVAERAAALRAASDRLEANSGEVFALLAREAGKTPLDTVAELREAVDFLRYYADEAERRGDIEPAGTVVAISPWNFPLAIFMGQVAAALAMGNAVLAKPAETTPLIAHRAVEWLHEAGVPRDVLQFLPGDGRSVGSVLTSTPGVDGVVFTGSTATAHAINRSMAAHLHPEAFLIAETGGLNAMIVDSTALPEQAVRDVLGGAFQSAGQRCSALRCLYVQDEVADGVIAMIEGAMAELSIGDPWALSTDVGPVITAEARADQLAYIEGSRTRSQLNIPDELNGHFVPPAIVEVASIADMEREVFGPVLHVARFKARHLDRVVADINATGYGLTFGLHTRIDDRVEAVTKAVRAGNLYVNRNQIGAVVESQPFGGEGMSGTGPKAGGPHYLDRFAAPDRVIVEAKPGREVSAKEAQAALDALPATPDTPLHTRDMPGPTGESNRLSVLPRGPVLCLGPDAESADVQAGLAALAECPALRIAPGAEGALGLDGTLAPELLETLTGFEVVALWADETTARPYREALARRDGPIVPLVMGRELEGYAVREKHVCVDTTAAGGNATLLAAVGAEGE